MMKNFIIALFVVSFALNALTVSAWAKPCMMDKQQTASSLSDIPCHADENVNQFNAEEPCNGVCLCLHVLLYQVPLLTESDTIILVDQSFSRLILYDERLRSQDYSPPRRPPRILI